MPTIGTWHSIFLACTVLYCSSSTSCSPCLGRGGCESCLDISSSWKGSGSVGGWRVKTTCLQSWNSNHIKRKTGRFITLHDIPQSRHQVHDASRKPKHPIRHLQQKVQALVEVDNAQRPAGSGGTLGGHGGRRCTVQQAQVATMACWAGSYDMEHSCRGNDLTSWMESE